MIIRLITFEEKKEDYNKHVKPKQPSETESHQNDFNCNQCEYKSNREITLKKQINTAHPLKDIKVSHDVSCEQNCVLCDDKFITQEDFNINLEKHLEEIRGMDPVKELAHHQSIPTRKANLTDARYIQVMTKFDLSTDPLLLACWGPKETK